MEDDLEDLLEFLKVVDEIVKEIGKMYEFDCPICKCKAKGIKNDYNGHLFAECNNCGIKIIE